MPLMITLIKLINKGRALSVEYWLLAAEKTS